MIYTRYEVVVNHSNVHCSGTHIYLKAYEISSKQCLQKQCVTVILGKTRSHRVSIIKLAITYVTTVDGLSF